MSIMHDFQCKKHGIFEASHPICPYLGCDSSKVQQVYLQAPGILSGKTKNFDKHSRRTSESMDLPNFKSTQHAGDSSFMSQHQGSPVLWGNDAAQYFGGVESMAAAASAPLQFEGRSVAQPSGMRAAANGVGLTQSRLPPVSERLTAAGDKPLSGNGK